MADESDYMQAVLDSLGPTNRIARALVNRLELAEDRRAEAEAISDELDDIWAAITDLAVRTADAFERGIARLEDEANGPPRPVTPGLPPDEFPKPGEPTMDLLEGEPKAKPKAKPPDHPGTWSL
jgi:hypothetical protein